MINRLLFQGGGHHQDLPEWGASVDSAVASVTCRRGCWCSLEPQCQSKSPPTPCHSSPPPRLSFLPFFASHLLSFCHPSHLFHSSCPSFLPTHFCPLLFISHPLSVSNITKVFLSISFFFSSYSLFFPPVSCGYLPPTLFPLVISCRFFTHLLVSSVSRHKCFSPSSPTFSDLIRRHELMFTQISFKGHTNAYFRGDWGHTRKRHIYQAHLKISGDYPVYFQFSRVFIGLKC